MFSVVYQLSQQAAPGATAVDGGVLSPVHSTLITIDQIVAVLAGLVLLGAVGARMCRRGNFSLALAPARPNTLREDALALAVAFYLISILALSGIVKAVQLDLEGPVAGLIIGSGAQLVGLLVCLVIASRRFEGGVHAYVFGLPGIRAAGTLRWTLGVGFVAIGLCPLIAHLTVSTMMWWAPDFEIPTHPTLMALKEEGASFGLFAALWFGAAVIAPIAEEFFFRGFVQTMLGHVFAGRWTPIVLTASAFGLVHYSQPHAVPALIVLAILIGYAYERTGSLVAPVLIHALFNLKTLLWEAISVWLT